MGAPVHLILMRIPPGHSALIGTELLGAVFTLGDCAAAIPADGLFGQFGISQAITPAERFDCIDGYASLRRNIGIADSGISHTGDLLLLRSCQVNSSWATAIKQPYSLSLERSSPF